MQRSLDYFVLIKMTQTKNEPQLSADLVKKIDGLFLHGKLTPNQSMDLPEGQYTVAEVIRSVADALEEQRRAERVNKYLEENEVGMLNGVRYFIANENRNKETN